MSEKAIMPFPKMSLAGRRELFTVIMMLPVYGLAATVEEVPAPKAPLECLLIEQASIKGNLPMTRYMDAQISGTRLLRVL